MKPENEEEAHALTLGSTIQWLRGFAAARNAYQNESGDMPSMWALESALKYFQSRANGEYDTAGPRPDSPEDEGIKALASYGNGTIEKEVEKPKRRLSQATKVKLSKAATARWAKRNKTKAKK